MTILKSVRIVALLAISLDSLKQKKHLKNKDYILIVRSYSKVKKKESEISEGEIQ